MNDVYDYGLWPLVVINSAFFIFFAFSFIKPKTSTDWRSLGVFSGFVLALFVEMYGFPLTVYLLSGWLASSFPEVSLFSHENGHLLSLVFAEEGNPHWSPLHIFSNLLIGLGFVLLAIAWRSLYDAQKEGRVAKAGPYRYCRHPQYLAFIIVMLGFLFQWPTLPTVLMFPVLVFVYTKLAKREESDSIAYFGDEYLQYKRHTNAWLPPLLSSRRERI